MCTFDTKNFNGAGYAVSGLAALRPLGEVVEVETFFHQLLVVVESDSPAVVADLADTIEQLAVQPARSWPIVRLH